MAATSRERVLAAFEFELVDMVPVYHVGFSGDAASKILGREVFVGGVYSSGGRRRRCGRGRRLTGSS